MRILFLNLWHGKLADPLRDFLERERSFDIACFQEMDDAVDPVLTASFLGYHRVSSQKFVTEKDAYSIATFVHPRFEVTGSGELLREDDETGLALALTLCDGAGRSFHIFNVHGVPRRRVDGAFIDTDDKLDFPARLRQTEELLAALRSSDVPAIMGGDFNILPEADSIGAFRESGYRDLIQEFAIPTTRNRLAWERYPNPYLYSDYVFTTPEVPVRSLSVQDVEISDHLPLILEVADL